MTQIIFKTAERCEARLRIGLAGPSGSGKTLGALRLAQVLSGYAWARVFVIDTEHGSAALYSHLGPFMHYSMPAPFSPRNYTAAIRAAEEAGAKVIVVDSLSHAWVGSGGALEMVDEAAARSRSGNRWAAWRDVTPHHNDLVDAIIQSPCDLLCTLRAKTEYVQEKDEHGKTVISKVGLAPIQREGMEYEFTAFVDVSLDHWATATKDRTETLAGRFQLTDEIGQRLANWRNAEIRHELGPAEGKTLETPEQIRRRWIKFCQERNLTRELIAGALGTEKISEWLAAAPGRTLDQALALFNGGAA